MIQTSCKNDSPTTQESSGYMASGILVGYDARMCACCGGLILNLSGDTTRKLAPIGKDDHLITNSNEYFGFNSDSFSQLPKHIEFDYTKKFFCMDTVYTITRFRFR